GRIVGGPHEPVIEHPVVRQRPCHVGDFTRYLADLFGHRKQELRAKTVRRERYRGFRLRRGGLRRLRGIGDRAQRLDDLRALLVVGKRLERPLRLIWCQDLGVAGGRRSALLRESRESNQAKTSRIEGRNLCDTRASLNKVRPTAKPGAVSPSRNASCRIACFRRHRVSEVCHCSGFLLAFAASPPCRSARSPGTSQ